MIDTHSHIDMLENPDKSIKESIEAGVEHIILPSSSPDNFQNVIELSRSYDCISGALGVHPEDVLKFDNAVSKDIFNSSIWDFLMLVPSGSITIKLGKLFFVIKLHRLHL